MKIDRLLIFLMLLCLRQQTLAARRYGGVYIRTTPSVEELRVQEKIAIEAEKRKLRAEEEREIDRIGLEMAKLGRTFVGGRPYSVKEAVAQYSIAASECQRRMSENMRAREDRELQDERFASKMLVRRRVPTGRIFGVQTHAADVPDKKSADACPKCNRGCVKCPACGGTRMISNAGGAGCAPCTSCTDGSIPCRDCDGKGVLK